MGAFTTLSSGGNAQDLIVGNELIAAWNERRLILLATTPSGNDYTSTPLLVEGDNAQDKSLWNGMQSWLETKCVQFVDHENGPLNATGDGFLYFTLATWRAVAGLNANGFRRSTDGTTMEYGSIAIGDVRGSWNFEDLQKGFSALKKTNWTTYSKVADKRIRDAFESYAAHLAGWAAATWKYDSGGAIYKARARKTAPPQGEGYSSFRNRSIITVSSLPAIDRAMDIYLYPVNYGDTFFDFDNTGCTGYGKWYLHDSVPIFSGSSRALDYIGNIDTCPVSLAPLSPGVGYDFHVDYANFLTTWNFTNG